MINFKFLLGLYPSTSHIEARENALLKEYEELEAYKKTKELLRFLELKEIIEDPSFEEKKKNLKALDYKKTEAYQKECEYNILKKSKRIINYYKVIHTDLYNNYLNIKDSDDLKLFYELKEFVESEEFKNKFNQLKELNFKTSEEYLKEKEYNELKKSKLIKNYYKVIGSTLFKNYEEIYDSNILKDFLKLKEYAESEKIKELKEKTINSKFSDTEEYKKMLEFQSLTKSNEIKNYFKVKKSKEYAIFIEIDGTPIVSEYKELEAFLLEPSVINLKNDKAAWEESEAKEKEEKFKQLSKDQNLKIYFKFIQSEQYKHFVETEKLGIIDKYEELHTFIQSDDFVSVKNYYSKSGKERWQETPEYQKVAEYESLAKDKKIVDYYKFVNSKEFALYQEAVSSGIVKKFEELKEVVESDKFIKTKEYLLLPFNKKWEQTEEYLKEQQYKSLASDKRIKDYIKFINSKEFLLFDEVSKTDEIPHFEELEKYIQSEEFIEYKKYMLLSYKEKWNKTEEFAQENEYNELLKLPKIKWYLKVVDSPKFDDIKAWKLTFTDDFENEKLDGKKWLTRFYWGDTFLHDAYSLSEDRHFNTDGQNIEIKDSILKIEVRKEKVTGKAWTPLFGFMPKEFDYTAGLINTGKSFRQQYGKFRAKIRMSGNNSVTSAFWLVGKQIIPHIDISKYNRKFLSFNTFWGNLTEKDGVKHCGSKMWSLKPDKKFYIYELEWTPNELIWRINNLEVFRTNEGVPSEPMYLQLSAGILSDVKNNSFPSSMEIDWVRGYERASDANLEE